MKKIKGYTIEQIKDGFAAAERAAAENAVRMYTVDELVVALREAAAKSPQGGMTRVRIGDWEGNLSAHGLVETLEVRYDPWTSRVAIFCDPNEC